MSNIMIGSPVVVGLDHTIQVCRWVPQVIDSHYHWITSFRNAVFPPCGLCKDSCAMADASNVILGGISRTGT